MSGAAFNLGHKQLKKGRKYQQEWCEGQHANQWRKADGFDEAVFYEKKRISKSRAEDTHSSTFTVYTVEKNQKLLWEA